MPRWRELKAKMLSTVHKTFEIDAVYLTHAQGSPVRVTVRIHRKPSVETLTLGDFSDAAASSWALEDVVWFDLAQIARPLPGSYVIVSRQEAYILDSSKPSQDGYQAVAVREASAEQIAAMLIVSRADATDPTWQGLI